VRWKQRDPIPAVGPSRLRSLSMRSSRLRRVSSIGVGVLAIAAVLFPRVTLAMICVALALVAAAAAVVYVRMRRSRPLLNGAIAAAGLDRPIAISRDASGIPIVAGATRGDVAFGLGFLHAQERFFQMDMSRRAAAGELAAVLGKAYVIADRRARVHQFRKRAQRIEAALPADQRELLSSYTAGVREGLRHLRAPPIEYLFLRTRPQEWRSEDTLLIVFNWYRLLQDETAEQDFHRYLLYASLPQIVADFLVPEGSPDWDAPLVGPRTDPVPVPSPDEFDLRRALPQRCPEAQLRFAAVPGSNAWAVAGEHTKSGKAIVANDMHLPYAMPATFYRATLEIGDMQPRTRLSGFTMPGFPFLVAGTNGRIAWGLANAAIDAMHLVRLDQTNLASHSYRTKEGVEEIQSERETIHVRGDTDVVMTVKQTKFGPISRKASDGAVFAQSWLAYDAESVNLAWEALETAASVDQAMDAANRLRVPALSIVIGDDLGNIGWTLAGPLPRPSRLPLSSTEPPELSRDHVPVRYPRFGSPEMSRVWAANARAVTSGPLGDLLAHGYHVCGARASQIRDALLELEAADEISMLRIQRDDRALFLARWHALLVETLRSRLANHVRHVEVRAVLASWNGRASADSVAYRLVNQFRDTVARLAFEPFISIVRSRHGHFDLANVSDQLEVPLWRLVSERPLHMLAPWFADWEALTTAAASEAIEGASLPWGAANTLEMRHPLSSFVPLLGRLFDAPRAQLHGDLHMPLAQTSKHGPVFRFVITAGNEHDAIAHMAGGQAANRSAPYYLAGHDAWHEARPAPLAPGPTRYALMLKPLPPTARRSDLLQ
jgi:penicillin G amidase